MAFCNNANLLNVFVRHIANNQLRSLAEVATVAHQLKLLKDDFFASDQQAVAGLTVIRKMSLLNIHMIFVSW